jgi:hypothetical protein
MKTPMAACTVLLAGCLVYQPPPDPSPREDGTRVGATVGTTWDAVIDLFAARNIPIRTIERASGLIATDVLSVSEEGQIWAHCGTLNGEQLGPNRGIYNVLVRGDSTSSTVRTTVRWTLVRPNAIDRDCSSTYVWERGLEQDVKERAEAVSRLAFVGAPANPSTTTGQAPPAEQALTGRHSEGSSEIPPAGALAPTPPQPRGDSMAVETPLPAGKGRSNAQLLRSIGFRRAISDVQRTKVIAGWQELRPDTLTLDLGDGAFTSSSTEYNLGRLYLAYRGTTDYLAEGALELRHGGRRVGLYTRSGLSWDVVR